MIATETEENRALDEPRVKQLTGGDKISARFMRGNFFEFWPTHKIWIHGNHKPRISGTDHGIWRRPLLVDFPVIIDKKDQDLALRDKLEGEAPGILNWMLVGCLMWQQEGLQPPDSVRVATERYRLEEDHIGAYIVERCVVEEGATEKGGALYNDYKYWCEQLGDKPVNGTIFGKSLGERGYRNEGAGRTLVRCGIRLAEASDAPSEV